MKIAKNMKSQNSLQICILTHKLKIPVGYERILSTWYGSDWQIPKKIESCHSIDKAFYDTENSYIKYENLSFEEYMKLFK